MINEEDIKEYFSDNEWEGMSENEKKMFTDFKITIDIPPHEDIQVKEEPADVDENMEELKIYPDILENPKQEPLEFDENYDSKDKLVETSEYKVSCNEILQKYQSDTIVKSEEGLSKEFQFVQHSPIMVDGVVAEDEATKKNDNVIEKKQFCCSKCRYKSSSRCGYALHLNIHDVITGVTPSGTRIFKCHLCEFESKHKVCVRNHIMYKHKKYTCPQCKYASNCLREMDNHVLGHKGGGCASEVTCECAKEFSCTRCSYSTRSERNLASHLRNKHSKEKRYRCSQCRLQTDNVSDFKIHLDTHLIGAEKRFKCLQCDYQTNYVRSLKVHSKSKHTNDVKEHKCTVCNYETNTKSNMKNHLATHDEVRPYECDECHQRFKKRHSLTDHALVHSGNEKFQCAHCDYKSNDKRNFIVHLKDKHLTQAEKDYKCPKCDYQTNRRASLELHLNVHKTVKSFGCDLCHRTFVQKRQLRRHLRVKHVGEKEGAAIRRAVKSVSNNI